MRAGREFSLGAWRRSAVAVGLTAVLLAGCSSDRPPPSPLVAFSSQLAAAGQWRTEVGAPVVGAAPVVAGRMLVSASSRGEIVHVDVAEGGVRSRVAVGHRLSTGVGTDGRRDAVVTQDNELIVTDAERVLWRAPLRAAVQTAPLVAGDRVFVLLGDRSVEAFDADNGRRLWTFPRSGDPLALSHAGVLLAYKDTLLAGVGSRLVLIDPLLGTARGEALVGMPRGTNEVERLADLTGPAARVGDAVCARAFQVAVSCVQPELGRTLWSRTQSGFRGVSADADLVVGGDSTDRLSAWRRGAGELVWSSEALRHRQLSAPLVTSQAVVVGDGQGWVHFLSRDRGETLQRLPTDGGAITAAPVLVDRTVIVQTSKGGLHAFRLP